MKRSKKLLCFGCIAAITLTVAVILDSKGNNIFAEEQNYSLVFSSSSNKLKTVGNGSYTAYSTTNGEIEFGYTSLATYTNGWQTINSNGSFYNVEPINGLTDITVNFSSTLKLYYGYSSDQLTNEYTLRSGEKYGFDGKTPSYFKISTSGTSSNISSININYTCVEYAPVATKTIRFELGADGSASHNDGTEFNSYSETVDGYTLTLVNPSKAYKGARDATGNSCIKLGAGSAAGKFSFTVDNDVTSVNIYGAKYKTNTSKLVVNDTTYTLTKNSNDGAYDTIEIDTTSNKTITVATTSGGYRAMINAIEWIVSSGGNSSSSSEPSSSEPVPSEPSSSESSREEPSSSTQPGSETSSETATLTFDDKAKRTSFSTEKQVWEENGITFTNNKNFSQNNIADYANPIRLYAGSDIVVEVNGVISEIEFDCNTSAYALVIKNSIGNNANINSDKVNVSNVNSETFKINSLTAQTRLDAITVTYSVSGSGNEGGDVPSSEPSSSEPLPSEPSSSEPSSSEPSSSTPSSGGNLSSEIEAYYSGITATSGNALLGQVRDLTVSSHKTYVSYDDSRGGSSGKTGSIDVDPKKPGNIVMFYTHASFGDMWDNGTTWNREHVWPQSLSNDLWKTSLGGADIHHIRPAFASINSARGNKLYGKANNGTLKTYSYKGTTYEAGYFDTNTWEPLDNVKGDVARIILYLFMHYNNPSNLKTNTTSTGTLTTTASSQGSGSLPITKVINANSVAAAFELLVAWNELDKVDDLERNRNEGGYTLQGNRNPFIDHPEYVEAIWG